MTPPNPPKKSIKTKKDAKDFAKECYEEAHGPINPPLTVKECPFCGNTPNVRDVGKNYSTVKCQNENCFMSWDRWTMLDKWNTRPLTLPSEKLDCNHKTIKAQDNNGDVYDVCVKCHKEVLIKALPWEKLASKEIEMIKAVEWHKGFGAAERKYKSHPPAPSEKLVPLDEDKVTQAIHDMDLEEILLTKNDCKGIAQEICSKFSHPPARLEREAWEKIIIDTQTKWRRGKSNLNIVKMLAEAILSALNKEG